MCFLWLLTPVHILSFFSHLWEDRQLLSPMILLQLWMEQAALAQRRGPQPATPHTHPIPGLPFKGWGELQLKFSPVKWVMLVLTMESCK